MTEFINLTPHAITIRTAEGDLTVPPSGAVARACTRELETEPVSGVPAVIRRFDGVEGPPPEEEGVTYIVSSLVIAALENNFDERSARTDVVAPDTGSTAIRNSDGHIVAVTRLVRPAY